MKSISALIVIGAIGFFATAFDPAREMWAPLIVSLVPLLAFLMWPVRDQAVEDFRGARNKAA